MLYALPEIIKSTLRYKQGEKSREIDIFGKNKLNQNDIYYIEQKTKELMENISTAEYEDIVLNFAPKKLSELLNLKPSTFIPYIPVGVINLAPSEWYDLTGDIIKLRVKNSEITSTINFTLIAPANIAINKNASTPYENFVPEGATINFSVLNASYQYELKNLFRITLTPNGTLGTGIAGDNGFINFNVYNHYNDFRMVLDKQNVGIKVMIEE